MNTDLIAFCKWCREMPLDQLAVHLAELGFDGVDLPVRDAFGAFTPAEAPKKLPEAANACEAAGIKLERLVTGITEGNDVDRALLDAAADVGIRYVRIGGYVLRNGADPRKMLDDARRNLDKLQKVLEASGVAGAIQNHSGPCLDCNASACLLMVEHCDPKWVGVQLDPGHLTLAGEQFHNAVGLLGPYMHTVNFKSPRHEYFADRDTGRLRFGATWVPLRDGMVDVPAVLDVLDKVGHDQPLSIHAEYCTHYHSIEQNAAATSKLIAEDVKYVRELFGK